MAWSGLPRSAMNRSIGSFTSVSYGPRFASNQARSLCASNSRKNWNNLGLKCAALTGAHRPLSGFRRQTLRVDERFEEPAPQLLRLLQQRLRHHRVLAAFTLLR